MKKNETPTATEIPPSPTTLPARKSRKGLVIAVVLIVIVIGAVASTYFIADANISAAINSCTTSVGDYRITNFTLFPPSVDMEVDLVISNPSDVNLRLNEFQADIFIEYGGANTTITLGSVDVHDKSLPAKGHVSVPATISAGTTLISFLATHLSGGYAVVVSGTLSFSGTWIFWTITKQQTESSREYV